MSDTHNMFDNPFEDGLELRIAELEHDLSQCREALEVARKGQPLGPVVGAQTIINQQHRINELERENAALQATIEDASVLGDHNLTPSYKAHIAQLERENAELRMSLQNCLDLAHGKFPTDHPWTLVNASKVLAKESGT